jgi:hypothetical protein
MINNEAKHAKGIDAIGRNREREREGGAPPATAIIPLVKLMCGHAYLGRSIVERLVQQVDLCHCYIFQSLWRVA